MIEQPGKKKMLLFSGSSNEELASNVASNLGTEVSTVESKEFASGEIYIRLNESVRGADCFVLQSHSGDINKTIMEQLVLVDALKSCLLYTSPSPRDLSTSRMPSSA